MQGYFGNLFLIQFAWQPQFCFPLQVFPPFSDCSNIPQQPLKSFTSNKAVIKADGFSPILRLPAQHNFQKFKFRREILEFRAKILNLSKKTFSLDNVSSKRFQAITNQIQEILMRYQAERPEKVTPRIQCLGKPRILKCPNHTLWMTKKSNMLLKLQSLL